MDNRKLLYGVLATVAVVGIAIAIYATVTEFSGGDNTSDNPDGVHFLCAGCGKSFVMTNAELSDHHKAHYGEPIPCPHCQSTQTSQAALCTKCGTPCKHDHTTGKTLCPKCKK